jgi:clan AA aspartic protease
VGTFSVTFTISNLKDSAKRLLVTGLVDTGASYPFIPEDVLNRLAVVPTGERTFVLADGSKKSFPIGQAELSVNDASAPCLVIFSPPGSEPLFGALALESLGLEVDPVNRRLKPATLYLASLIQ